MNNLKLAMITTVFTASFLFSNTLFAKAEENNTANTESTDIVNDIENNGSTEETEDNFCTDEEAGVSEDCNLTEEQESKIAEEKAAKIKDLSNKKLVRNSSLYNSFKKTKNYTTKYKYLNTLNKEYESYCKSSYKADSTIKDYKSKLSAMKKVIKANYDKTYKANYKASRTDYKSLKSKSKNLVNLQKTIKSQGSLVLGTKAKSDYLKKIRVSYLSHNYEAITIEGDKIVKKYVKKIHYTKEYRWIGSLDENNNLIKEKILFVDENRNIYYVLSGKKA